MFGRIIAVFLLAMLFSSSTAKARQCPPTDDPDDFPDTVIRKLEIRRAVLRTIFEDDTLQVAEYFFDFMGRTDSIRYSNTEIRTDYYETIQYYGIGSIAIRKERYLTDIKGPNALICRATKDLKSKSIREQLYFNTKPDDYYITHLNADLKPVRREHYNADGDLLGTTSTTYNDLKQVISIKEYSPDNRLLKYSEQSYINDSQIASVEKVYIADELSLVIRRNLDTCGRSVRDQYFDADNRLLQTFSFTFGDTGLLSGMSLTALDHQTPVISFYQYYKK